MLKTSAEMVEDVLPGMHPVIANLPAKCINASATNHKIELSSMTKQEAVSC